MSPTSLATNVSINVSPDGEVVRYNVVVHSEVEDPDSDMPFSKDESVNVDLKELSDADSKALVAFLGRSLKLAQTGAE